MQESPLSRAERRALKKQKREEQRRSEVGKKRFGKIVWVIALIVIIGGITAWFFYGIFSEKPGIQVTIQSREHINPGSQHDPYIFNPPTSGPHYATWSKCSIFEEAIPSEILIHNMEHGHVVVFYKPDIEAAQKDQVKQWVAAKLSKKNILMAPSKDIVSPFALAAWGWYQAFDTFNEQTFNTFYKAHKYRGPERIPCDVEEMEED